MKSLDSVHKITLLTPVKASLEEKDRSNTLRIVPSIRKMVEERGRTRRKQLRGKEQRDQETLF